MTLKRLIKLLEERLDKRRELEEHFYNSTGKYIDGFQLVVSEDELEEKKTRFSPEFEEMYMKMFGTKPLEEQNKIEKHNRFFLVCFYLSNKRFY